MRPHTLELSEVWCGVCVWCAMCCAGCAASNLICDPRHIEKLLNVQQPKHSSKLDEESKI